MEKDQEKAKRVRLPCREAAIRGKPTRWGMRHAMEDRSELVGRDVTTDPWVPGECRRSEMGP